MSQHTHPTAHHAGSRHRNRLAWVFGLVVIFMGAEIATGMLTGSLAMVSDAGHMATDALGLGMALAAIAAAGRASTKAGRTFGLYRIEILAALANAGLLFGVAGYVLYQAAIRLQDPPEVTTGPLLVVAILGLVVNIIGWWLLRDGARESLNVRGAYLEVLADLAGSVGVVIAALIIQLTGWLYADPLIAAAIGLFIIPRAWRLGRQAARVLVQAAPRHLDLDHMSRDLAGVLGVEDVHDLHVWTLTSGMDVASAHLTSGPEADVHAVLDEARELLQFRYEISHATLQVEPTTHRDCVEATW